VARLDTAEAGRFLRGADANIVWLRADGGVVEKSAQITSASWPQAGRLSGFT
jgi:hypothetical protein